MIERKMAQPLWKTAWQFLERLKSELPYERAVPLLGTRSRGFESALKAEMQIPCTPGLTAALVTIANVHQQMRG